MRKLTAKANFSEIRQRHYTQKEVAQLLAIEFKRSYDRSWFGKVERGERTIGLAEGVFVARLFKVEVTDIFESKEESGQED